MADAQRLEKELKLLRSTVDRLSNKVKENDELLRKCLYNENKFELQLALVKDQLTTFIEQKVFIQFSNLNQQFNSKFEKVNATIADLKSDLEKYNQDIKDDQIIRRSQLETIYEDRLSKEFEIHMEKFKTLILSTMKSLSAKQEDRLRKDLTDVMIGHVALKETELEGKIQEKLSENTKNNNEKLKVVILDYMKNTTMSYQEALRARVDQYLQDKVDELQNNVYQYVDKELKEITKKYHEQLRDDCEKEISDSLTEKKNQLTKIIVETLKAKFQQQRQELLESLITYINKKAEIHKTDILTNILTECNHRFYEINEELKINTKFVIDQEMKIQKHDLIEEFKMSNAKSFDFLSDKLHQLLSEEFDSEMKIIGSELRGKKYDVFRALALIFLDFETDQMMHFFLTPEKTRPNLSTMISNLRLFIYVIVKR